MGYVSTSAASRSGQVCVFFLSFFFFIFYFLNGVSRGALVSGDWSAGSYEGTGFVCSHGGPPTTGREATTLRPFITVQRVREYGTAAAVASC
jgi:hypothetical protein